MKGPRLTRLNKEYAAKITTYGLMICPYIEDEGELREWRFGGRVILDTTAINSLIHFIANEGKKAIELMKEYEMEEQK